MFQIRRFMQQWFLDESIMSKRISTCEGKVPNKHDYLHINQANHWDDIFQFISCMKIGVFYLIFHRKPGTRKQQAIIGLDNGLAPNKGQAIILTNATFVYWRM